MPQVTIIDYGVGNIASLRNAFRHLDIGVEVTNIPENIGNAEKLVLPGVGAFRPAMEKLQESGLDRSILEKAQNGTPLLGICLGMQLLFTMSNEQGEWRGLNLIPGKVNRFTGVKKIPHMGWNSLVEIRDSSITQGLDTNPFVYFVHSYYCEPESGDDTLASCDYGEKFCAAVRRENVWGVQFHPEKSQKPGLRILKNFAEKA